MFAQSTQSEVMKLPHYVLPLLLAFATPAVATVTVSKPVSGATVSSPVNFVASATAASTCSKGVAAVGIYVNSVLQYKVNGSSLNTSLTLSPGTDSNTVVQEWDNCGGASTTAVPITVSGGTTPTQTGIVVTAPVSGSTVASPVTFTASASSTCSAGVQAMGIYVNNVLKYKANGASLSTSLPFTPGTYSNTVVQEWDN